MFEFISQEIQAIVMAIIAFGLVMGGLVACIIIALKKKSPPSS